MKHTLFLALWIFLIFNQVHAQSAADSSFTLQQCIDYALKNHADVANAQLDERIAEGKIGDTRAIGYPQISGTVSLVDNPQLKRMFFSQTSAGVFGGGGSGGPSLPIKQSGDVFVSPNLFQLRSAGDAYLTLNQLIFDGSYIVGLQAASTYRELSQKSLIQTKIQTIENVTKAYYMVLVNQERAKVFTINIQRLDSTIIQTKALQKSGFVENIDIARLEVQYNNLMTEKQNFDNINKLGLLLLKFQMGMPIDQPVILKENLEGIQLDSSSVGTEAFDYTKRIEYSLLKTQEKLQTLDVKRIRYSRLPTLAAFGNLGIFRQDVAFGKLFRNDWYPYSMVGLNLSIPLLNLRSQYQAQQSKLTLKKTSNSLANLENGMKMDATRARLTYLNSLQGMRNQKRNMELAQEVARVTKIKYKEGVGSNLEVTNAESDLRQSQINYYQALYDALVARTDYQKATGTLYNGQ